MAEKPLVDLVMAAALIKAQMPQQFQQLCEAVRAMEVQAIVEMIGNDDPSSIFRAQGKVKTIQQIRKQLVECAELRDTYTKRRDNG
jgi:hypothetical protein